MIMANSRAGTYTEAQLLDSVTTILSRAAEKVLAFKPATIARRMKSDRSPVTAADEVANAIIVEGLARLLPGLPLISEESIEGQAERLTSSEFILVDPLDGTREFLEGRKDFTLNVAIIRDGRPWLGVIMAPAHAMVWQAIVGKGAERFQLPAGADLGYAAGRAAIHTRPWPEGGLVATVSHSHFDSRTAAFLAGLPIAAQVACGSSLKFCRLAEGKADLYPRLAPTHEWDIAAGHAILEAAGGAVTTPQGDEPIYGHTPGTFLVPAFIAWGDRRCVATYCCPGR
jgi:3'(2'), 5'-bisphosphate nucleotidase